MPSIIEDYADIAKRMKELRLEAKETKDPSLDDEIDAFLYETENNLGYCYMI